MALDIKSGYNNVNQELLIKKCEEEIIPKLVSPHKYDGVDS